MMYKVLTSEQLFQLYENLKDGLPGTAKNHNPSKIEAEDQIVSSGGSSSATLLNGFNTCGSQILNYLPCQVNRRQENELIFIDIFYTVRHMLRGVLPNFECLVDKWPNWTCIVLRPDANKEVLPFFANSYICHTNSASSLKYFLQRPGVIDWAKSANFSGIPYDLIAVNKEFARKLGGKYECREPHIMYAWCDAVSLDIPSPIPEGFSLDVLKKCDIPTVFKHWKSSLSEHKGIYDYFETIIQNFENSCLRDNATGEVVAYTCRKFNGSISMIYVQPKYRQKGFCHIVFADIVHKIINNGDIPFGFLATNDKELIETARKHHFTWVPQSNMTWASYEITHPF